MLRVCSIICTFIFVTPSDAGDKFSSTPISSVAIPRDCISSASFENKMIFESAVRIFEPAHRGEYTLSSVSAGNSAAKRFLPYQGELYAPGTAKPHYDTVVAAKPFNDDFLEAAELGMTCGDIAVLDRGGKRLVLVFVGNRRFSDGKKTRSFFIYPYVKESEYNTFPPRLHSGLVKILKRDAKTLKVRYRKDKYRSWLRTPLAGTQNKVFLRSQWRGRVGTTVSIYRLKKGAVPKPRRLFLKRPNDLICHRQVTALSCTWACLAQAYAYVEKRRGLREMELQLTARCLFGASFTALYTDYTVFAAMNEVRAILPQDFRSATTASLQQAGFTANQISLVRRSSQGVNASDAAGLLGPMVNFYRNFYSSRRGQIADGVIRFTYLSVAGYLMSNNQTFPAAIRRICQREARSPGHITRNRTAGDATAFSRAVTQVGDNEAERRFFRRVSDGVIARPQFLRDYYADAAAVQTVWQALKPLRRTSGHHASSKSQLLPLIIQQLSRDRPVIVGLDVPVAGLRPDPKECPAELLDAYPPVAFRSSRRRDPHAVLVIGYADLNDGNGYVYYQDGQLIPSGNPTGSTERKANFGIRVPHILKMRLDEFADHLHQAAYWDYGNIPQENVETVSF